jgi:hypothetical protein
MPEEFVDRDLSGARFENVNLTGATFRGTFFSDVSFQGCVLTNVDISAELQNVTINGIDVAALINVELDRRHPERSKLRPKDAAGFREAWPVIEGLWSETIARARQLDPELLHEQVDGEWSFIETLRHLVFASDAWVGRVILGNLSPWDSLDLPFDELPDIEGIPRDRDARPSLETMLELRADRMATVRRVLDGLTDDQLASSTTVETAGWPDPDSYPVRRALGIILNEEWWHRQFAERDLDALAARGSASG